MANDKEIEIKGKVDIDLSDTKEQVSDFTLQISNLDKEINKLQNTLAKQAKQIEIWANKEVKNKKVHAKRVAFYMSAARFVC